MTYIPRTKHYQKVLQDAGARRAESAFDATAYDLKVAVADGHMFKDGPSLRVLILSALEGWHGKDYIVRAVGRSVIGGVPDVIERMVKDGHLEMDQFRVGTGRWKWVKRENRPLMNVWRRTEAGTAELRRLEQRAAVVALASRRSR